MDFACYIVAFVRVTRYQRSSLCTLNIHDNALYLMQHFSFVKKRQETSLLILFHLPYFLVTRLQ